MMMMMMDLIWMKNNFLESFDDICCVIWATFS